MTKEIAIKLISDLAKASENVALAHNCNTRLKPATALLKQYKAADRLMVALWSGAWMPEELEAALDGLGPDTRTITANAVPPIPPNQGGTANSE